VIIPPLIPVIDEDVSDSLRSGMQGLIWNGIVQLMRLSAKRIFLREGEEKVLRITLIESGGNMLHNLCFLVVRFFNPERIVLDCF
jgi:hypothetical protein